MPFERLKWLIFQNHKFCPAGSWGKPVKFSGITTADKLSLLPFLNALLTMRSANEEEDEHEHELLDISFTWTFASHKRSQTFCGFKLSKMPSDATTK